MDTYTSAVKHLYIHKHTESEHWQECKYCHVTTEKSAHKLGAWETVVKAGYTFEGEKQRECKICEYALKEAIPILSAPADKFVVVIPGYDKLVTSDPSSDDGTSSSGVSGEIGSDNPTANPSGSDSTPTVSTPATKELLTKGEENSVPALPILSPTEDGNIFVGWINKATGEAVKKGDKLTENIEIAPAWKDCGEGNHTDANEDNNCDDCGYILVKPSQPEGTNTSDSETTADNERNGENTSQAKDGAPSWGIILISCFGGVIVVCGVILVVVLKKKK